MNENLLINSEIQLEQEILGGLISSPRALTQYVDLINEKFFRINSHKAIFNGILEMYKKGLAIDLVSFLTYHKNKTKEMNSISYVSEVAACNPSISNFKTKVELLKENYKISTIKGLYEEINTLGTASELTELLENTLKEVYGTTSNNDLDIAADYDQYLIDLYSENDNSGFKSGLRNLDNVLGNFKRGRMISIFARSGVGKTTVSVQIALNMVMQKHKVIYGSGEMSKGEVYNKMVASKLNIPYEALSNKSVSIEDKDKISRMITYMLDQDFYVTTTTDIDKFIAEIKLYKMKHGLDVVFVDYVNKYCKTNNNKNLTQQIGEVTNRLKDLAQKENICVVLLAQANREADKKAGEVNEKISEGDIQDSARIEQDSDQVIALYRNKKLDNAEYRQAYAAEIDYNSKSADRNPNCINMIVQKNRHGKKGTFAFIWNGEYSRVSNFER